jgi:hypothetical protein
MRPTIGSQSVGFVTGEGRIASRDRWKRRWRTGWESRQRQQGRGRGSGNRPEKAMIERVFVQDQTIYQATSMARGTRLRLKATVQACGARGLRLWRWMLKIEEFEEREEGRHGGNSWLQLLCPLYRCPSLLCLGVLLKRKCRLSFVASKPGSLPRSNGRPPKAPNPHRTATLQAPRLARLSFFVQDDQLP